MIRHRSFGGTLLLRVTLFLSVVFISSTVVWANQNIAGWIETVSLSDLNIQQQAKLDTGAAHSSVKAENITYVQRSGVTFVRFEVVDINKRSYQLELPLLRHTIIRKHQNDGERRAVVLMKVCVGGISKKVEVNLAKRKRFEYPVLIGRSYLESTFLVDSSRKHRLETACS